MTSGRLAIGLDLGGTQIRAALIDEAGTILARRAVPTAAQAGAAVVLDQLRDAAAAVGDGVPRERLLGIGLAAPGPLDAVNGMALSTPTIAGFTDLPLRQALGERTGQPVWLENDGIAAALGEWRHGAGRGVHNLVYVTVSTGIGGGVVQDGRIAHGRMGMAGHIGHMTIERDGEACVCGGRGCWEAYGSGPALGRRAQRRAAGEPGSPLATLPRIDARAVFDAASQGDRLAADLVAEEADILGIGVVSLLHLYSPDIVILGGGVAQGFGALLPGIAARIAATAMPPFRAVPVVRAALGEDPGLIGAATVVFDARRAGTSGEGRA